MYFSKNIDEGYEKSQFPDFTKSLHSFAERHRVFKGHKVYYKLLPESDALCLVYAGLNP